MFVTCVCAEGSYFGRGAGGSGEARGGLGPGRLGGRGAQGGRVPGQRLHASRDDGIWDLRHTHTHTQRETT